MNLSDFIGHVGTILKMLENIENVSVFKHNYIMIWFGYQVTRVRHIDIEGPIARQIMVKLL